MSVQVTVPVQLTNNQLFRVPASGLPWERSRFRFVLSAAGGNGGPVFGFRGRPDATMAELNKSINGGGIAQSFGQGEADWDYFFSGTSGNVWYSWENDVTPLTLVNVGASVVWGMLIFEEQPHEHCPHCRVKLGSRVQ